MAVGESQDCNCMARGWLRRLLLVFFSYAPNAALKIDWKLEEDEGVWELWDIVKMWL